MKSKIIGSIILMFVLFGVAYAQEPVILQLKEANVQGELMASVSFYPIENNDKYIHSLLLTLGRGMTANCIVYNLAKDGCIFADFYNAKVCNTKWLPEENGEDVMVDPNLRY